MFASFMIPAWIVGTLVAVVGGAVGFFIVLRGATFVAHAIPNGSFAGAAAASLAGVSTLLGLGVFAVGGALGISALRRGGRHDVATALTLVVMLALGSLLLSFQGGYAPAVYAILFGQVLGVGATAVWPTVALTAICLGALALLWRPLLSDSVLPAGVASASRRHGAARALSPQLAFLLLVALATTMTVPLVGTALIFSLMVGPPAAARAFTTRPGTALALAVALALFVVWAALALAYMTDWPVGFFVGTLSACAYVLGRAYNAARAYRLAPSAPAQIAVASR